MTQQDFNTTSKHSNLGQGARVNPGIYIGRVENNIDPGRMGQIEVNLFSSGKQGASIPGDKGSTVVAKRVSHYGGQLQAAGLTQTDEYDHNQQSYGFFGSSPDVGSMVLVVVTEGGDGDAYYLGYIPDTYMNANPFSNLECEYNKKVRPPVTNDPSKNERKMNEKGPFKGTSSPSAGLYESRAKLEHVSGTGACPDRGYQTSGPRREAPSCVTGISSPGPLKYDGPMLNRTAQEEGKMIAETPYSRLGGTCIVCDDGNPGWNRTSLAKDGPREYVPAPGGESTIPHSEQFYIETRTGHKIIMHNSEDFISIIHSNGDSWMEFTANGKIDVYSRGGISMATEKDEKAGINFHAHQLNIDVDELNISATTAINIEQRPDPQADPVFALRVNDGKFDVQATKGIDIQNKQDFASGDPTFKMTYDQAGDEFTFNPTRKTQLSTSGQDIAIKGNLQVAGNLEGDNNPGDMEVGPLTSDQTMLYDEKPGMMTELPASYPTIDKEVKKHSDVTDTLWSSLGRVPRKHPWKHSENLDPKKFTPEQIAFGGKPEDAEPVLIPRRSGWHQDEGDTNAGPIDYWRGGK